MWAIVGAVLQVALILLKKWSKWDDVKRAEAESILKDAKGKKDASSITSAFDRINAL